MAAWVSGTTEHGEKIFLNLDLAATVRRLPGKLTRIAFPGGRDEYFDLKEEPADLFGRAGFSVP